MIDNPAMNALIAKLAELLPKCTPGPWRVSTRKADDTGIREVWSGPTIRVCDCGVTRSIGLQEQIANAALIALAPDIAAAYQALALRLEAAQDQVDELATAIHCALACDGETSDNPFSILSEAIVHWEDR